MLRLHDTALGRVVDLDPREPGRVSMYVCGPTVYDLPHIGHGRFALVFDVLRRYLEWSGFEVRYVSNVTDIDDNIIRRAEKEGRSAEEVAVEYERVWWEAMDGLGVRRPDADPHATAYVERMVELVERLFGADKAYETSDGVYFVTESVPDYGLLARQPVETLRAGARVEVGEEKRSPLDFALWKKAKEGEPAWPSPWGRGRPGWHTECVVMSLDLLGDGFDLHGGGQDLAFPHHENERAQAVALGHRFSRHWVHNGWVEVEGVKMSKSLKNFTTITELLERADGRAYRLLVLQSHYRSPVEVTAETVDRAERSLAGLDSFARNTASLPAGAPDRAELERFRQRMDDDLDTPGAIDRLFRAVREGNTALNDGRPEAAAAQAATVREMAVAVGLPLWTGTIEVDAETRERVARRDEARRRRHFAAADAIREELVSRGWAVEDTPWGTRIYR